MDAFEIVLCELVFCVFLTIGVGCDDYAAYEKSSGAIAPEDYVNYLANIDIKQRDNESYADLRERVYERIETPIRGLESVPLLKDLFWACHKHQREAANSRSEDEGPGGLDRVGLFWEAQTAIIFKLGDLKTDESAKLLVALLQDESLYWDGESAFAIGGAITRCGNLALPYLEQITHGDRKDFAKRLVGYIQKGEVHGP